MRWDPDRLAFNCACYDQAIATMEQAARQNKNDGGVGFPVVVVGSL